MTLHCIYSISDNSYPKERFSFATKQYCLTNFVQRFGLYSKIHLLVDNTNLKQETRDFANQISVDTVEYYDGGSSAASWRKAVDYILKNVPNDDYFYRVEDDYLHRYDSYKVLMEGLARADLCTLYLHGDRFIPASFGGSKFCDDAGSFMTRLLKTESSFWCQIESTTMSFASSPRILKEDMHIWEPFTLGTHPHDFEAFLEITKKGRTLISPVPGFSTHCEDRWKSPLIDWSDPNI